MEHLRANGFTVREENTSDLDGVKSQFNVPQPLHACHTAIVDGYVIEGHVPAADIVRLLDERPEVTGIAVPGMPVGSPGMEVPGQPAEPYDVVAFDASGPADVFASH